MADENKILPEIVTAHWHKVIRLQISDPELQRRVEGFLDFFQQSRFPYQAVDQRGIPIGIRYMSGQSILQAMQKRLEVYNSGKEVAKDHRRKTVSGTMLDPGRNMEFDENRYTLADHGQPFNKEDPSTGSMTFSMDKEEKLPVGIKIGRDFLLGAQYYDLRGNKHPVNIDSTLARELANVAYASAGKAEALKVEGIVSTALGGTRRRIESKARYEFEKNSNGGYQTLYDKQPERRGELYLDKGGQTDHARANEKTTKSALSDVKAADQPQPKFVT